MKSKVIVRTVLISAASLLAAVLVSCAGLINGSTQLISVDSNIKGAKVEFIPAVGPPIPLGETPFTGSVPRNKGGAQITVSKDGVGEKSQIATSSISIVFFLNFFVPSGTFSSTTDLTQGTAWEYSPSNFYINFETDKTSLRGYEFKRDSEVKAFAMKNYQQILVELGDGNFEGGYLDQLLNLMGNEKDRSRTIDVIKQIALKSEWDAVLFGEKVADYMFRKV